ncbi:MAG: nicotinate-nucleotide adenylyltransferase [Hyphomonadaceae bacterium]|nr:nicotinate-nucleotide adenylyltransferase [Hyphomonadaceae bacterium]
MTAAARARRTGLPRAYRGMRIGLFGGSFDPAHEGHAHVAETARKRLQLHQVWWLAAPQNPLKANSSPLPQRLASMRRVARGRAMIVTDIESRWGVRYTADTLKALRAAYPGVRFVWVMGGDNIAAFRRWRRWGEIFRAAPIAILSRPLAPAATLGAKPFARFAAARLAPCRARRLADADPPAWAYFPARHVPASSTLLRAARVANRPSK